MWLPTYFPEPHKTCKLYMERSVGLLMLTADYDVRNLDVFNPSLVWVGHGTRRFFILSRWKFKSCLLNAKENRGLRKAGQACLKIATHVSYWLTGVILSVTTEKWRCIKASMARHRETIQYVCNAQKKSCGKKKNNNFKRALNHQKSLKSVTLQLPCG